MIELDARLVSLDLAEPLVIARGSLATADTVEVAIRRGAVTGYGEAAPLERYGESAASALAYVQDAASELGNDPFAVEEVMARLPLREFAGRAAIDAALHDLMGKLRGEPVWRMLGLRQLGPPTSWTIGLASPDEMADKARRARDSRRFKRLKLKLGGGDGRDVERVNAVREVTDAPLQVDVNEGWSIDEAIDALPRLGELGVEYCEQPLPKGAELAARVKVSSPIPIFVDEDCHTLRDVKACSRIAHGVNIKLAKSGGLLEAMRMSRAARTLGLGVMIGCMLESSLGVAAGAAMASLCDYADLDGNLLLDRDPWQGLKLQGGVQVPATAPGLGVSPHR